MAAVTTTCSEDSNLMVVHLPEMMKQSLNAAQELLKQLTLAVQEQIKTTEPPKQDSKPAAPVSADSVMPVRRQAHHSQAHHMPSQNMAKADLVTSGNIIFEQKKTQPSHVLRGAMQDLQAQAKGMDYVNIKGSPYNIQSCFSTIRHHLDVADSCKAKILNGFGENLLLAKDAFANMNLKDTIKNIGQLLVKVPENILAAFRDPVSAVKNSGLLGNLGLKHVNLIAQKTPAEKERDRQRNAALNPFAAPVPKFATS